MKEFDYELDYKNLDFTVEENRKLYRIGRGEQGVLLVLLYLLRVTLVFTHGQKLVLQNVTFLHVVISVFQKKQ